MKDTAGVRKFSVIIIDFDYTIQSDTTQLTQPHHNCIDTLACRTASATSQFILFVIWIQSPLSHNVTFVYLIRVDSTVIVPKLIITRLLWAPAGYEKPKPRGTEETYSPNPMQVPLPYEAKGNTLTKGWRRNLNLD